MSDYRYDAFISYNHADIALAKRLSARIRRYRAPRALGLPHGRIVPFRDVEQLTITGDLTDTLVERLQASRHLVVLCSPGAAQSKYVNQEIEYFASQREADAILTVLCSGEPGESFPPALKRVMDEPLFVDLRPRGGRLQRFRRFRAESLRIIASLLGVDYSSVAREDERRRRRTRALSGIGVVATAAAIAALFLVNSVEPQAWKEVPLPTSGMDLPDFSFANPLMPVRDIAFSNDDPASMIFMVRDAEWHTQKPQGSVALRQFGSPMELRSVFERAISEHEQAIAASTGKPFLSLAFSVHNHDDEQTARGTAELYSASVIDESRPGFYQVLSITRTNPALPEFNRRFVVPAKQLSSHSDPVLDWPADVLFANEFIPRDGTVRGEFRSNVDRSGGEFEYLIMDAMDEFLDAIGPERFDRRLASNVSDLQIDYDGFATHLADVDIAEESRIWQQLLDSGNWITYSAPVIRQYRIVGREREGSDARISDLVDQLDGETALARDLAQSEIDTMEMRSAAILSRDEPAGRFRIATLLGREEHGIAHSATAMRTTRELFLQGPEQTAWRPISVPTTDPAATVSDLRVLDSDGRKILLVFGGEGFFRSLDGGETWTEFNVGEKRLAGVGAIKTVLVGAEPVVYALVDADLSGDGSRDNFLFRLERRNWRARLRIALVERLTPQ